MLLLKPTKLIVLSGPSGVGKGTLCRGLLESRQDIQLCVSATTRVIRPGEVDGEHYHFLTPEAFDQKVEAGDFIEWAEFAGSRYGTLKQEVEAVMDRGHFPMVEIDVKGAQQIKANMPHALLIFICPPSQQVLRERLIQRGLNTEEDIQRRLAIAEKELDASGEFNQLIENDALPQALSEIQVAIATYLQL